MIPRTFPSTYETANGDVRMVVYFITDLSGLDRWVDYIPVKFAQLEDQKTNSYDNNGIHLVDPLSSTSGKQAWVDYIPVYADPDAEDAWYVSAQGYIPVGFSAAPTLSLDFTSSSETLDPRVTFSRGSLATRTNSSGVIEYAPHNLLTNSEQFDNAAWGTSNLSITSNTIVAPDGTLTGDKLVENTANSLHLISRSSTTTITANTNHTFSCYIKAAERTKVILRFAKNGTPFTSNNALFDLSAVSATTSSTGFATTNTPTITAVGNGWYRCTMGGVLDASSTDGAFQIRLVDASNNTTYTGDGTSGIYIWGAQLNVGALQPYYPTTVKNLLGYSEAFDNAAWTKSNSFIQTNLLTYSEQFDNSAWVKTRGAVSANTIASPNGTLTADTFTADGSSLYHSVSAFGIISGAALRTFSIFVKAGTQSIVQLNALATSQTFANFDLSTGVIGSFGTDTTANIQSIGDGWWRCSITSSASTDGIEIGLVSTLTSIRRETNTLSTSIYIWGAQLVQGSTPGDYQQTFSTALPVQYEAPNGTMTADKLVENTANDVRYIAQVPAAFVSGTEYTLSFYAKAAERTTIDIRGANAAVFAGRAVFDLVNGTVQSVIYGSASIEPVGNGWYRCVVFGTATDSAGTNMLLYLNGGLSYTGDGTSGIYIWGAQLSDSASVDPYVATPGAAPSAAAYYGPRFDYDPVTLAPKGLLIEEQRTNLLLQSDWAGAVAGSPGTAPTSWSIGFGTGTQTSLVTSIYGTADGAQAIKFDADSGERVMYTQTINVTSGVQYAASVYIEAVSGSIGEAITIVAGTATRTIDSFVISPQTPGRYTLLFTADGTGTVFVRYGIGTTFAVNNTCSVTMSRPQIEAGSFPTSYIPTTTAQVTRAADAASMTGTNFSSWYNADEGTLYAEASVLINNELAGIASFDDNTSSNRIDLRLQSSTVRETASTNGVAQATITAGASPTANTAFKVVGSYKVDDFSASLNGAATVNDTTALVPQNVDRLQIGNLVGTSSGELNGTVKKLAYYPTRLSNVQLQALTS